VHCRDIAISKYFFFEKYFLIMKTLEKHYIASYNPINHKSVFPRTVINRSLISRVEDDVGGYFFMSGVLNNRSGLKAVL